MRTLSFIKSGVLFLLLALLQGVPADAQQRELKAYLFPYLPDQDVFYQNLEQAFEKKYPSIDLKIVLDEDYYYDGGLTDSIADVYEIDCIFLDEMVRKGRIDPFPDQNYLTALDTLNYDGVHSAGGKLYAVPHWICSYFMIYHKDDAALRGAAYLKDIEQVLGTDKGALSMSLGSDLSLGQAYMDGLRDDRPNKADITAALSKEGLDPTGIRNMERLLAMVKKDGNIPDSGVERFLNGEARACVSYAETMNEILHKTGSFPYFKKENLMIRDWPLSDNGSRPLGWVDALAVRKGLDWTKTDDAMKFINFLLSDEGYRLALVPRTGEEVPRYLLPPYKKYYHDSEILQKAPLYKALYPLVENFGPLKLPQVTNEGILETGRKVRAALGIPEDLLKRSARGGHPARR